MKRCGETEVTGVGVVGAARVVAKIGPECAGSGPLVTIGVEIGQLVCRSVDVQRAPMFELVLALAALSSMTVVGHRTLSDVTESQRVLRAEIERRLEKGLADNEPAGGDA